jgi:hypothetical protein
LSTNNALTRDDSEHKAMTAMTSSNGELDDDAADDTRHAKPLSNLEIARQIARDTLADDHQAVELNIRVAQIT